MVAVLGCCARPNFVATAMGNCGFGAVTSVFVDPVSPPMQPSVHSCAEGWFGSQVAVEQPRMDFIA